jgi:hypothetical protein
VSRVTERPDNFSGPRKRRGRIFLIQHTGGQIASLSSLEAWKATFLLALI